MFVLRQNYHYLETPTDTVCTMYKLSFLIYEICEDTTYKYKLRREKVTGGWGGKPPFKEVYPGSFVIYSVFFRSINRKIQ